MADTKFEIDPTYSLAEIESAIQYKEQDPSKFMQSVITTINNKLTNIATFQDLPNNATPKQFKMQLANANAPTGFALAWSGPMIVAGSNVVVSAYRK